MTIAVIGAGIAGAATAWHAASRGHRVVGFDQFDRGHSFGSSHGTSRIIRRTYPDPMHTRLMDHAYRLWDTAESEIGGSWRELCGIVYFGTKQHPELVALESALNANQIPWERWDPIRVQEEAGIRLRADEIAIHQRDGGYLRADAAVDGLLELSERYGAEWHFRTRVDALSPTRQGIVVATQFGESIVDRVALCAGPWISHWTGNPGWPLHVTRQTWAFFNDGDGPRQVWIDAGSHGYGFPADGRIAGSKVAFHREGNPVDPDHVERALSGPEIAELCALANDRLGCDPVPGAQGTCLYTNTPDGLFALGHGIDPRLLLVSPCSGHGFKFGPLVGSWVTDALETGEWPVEALPFAATRFWGELGNK